MVNPTHYKMRISKKNEVYLVISDIEDSTREELTSFFTFEVPGFKFMPMYRSRMWDGKIRLFSPATGEIYVGLLEEHMKEQEKERKKEQERTKYAK